MTKCVEARRFRTLSLASGAATITLDSHINYRLFLSAFNGPERDRDALRSDMRRAFKGLEYERGQERELLAG